LWDEYCGECDAIVFVVDSGDTERLAEAADELWRVLELLREQAVPPAVAIMANKCDLKHAMADAELLRALKIEQYVGVRLRLPRLRLGMRARSRTRAADFCTVR
jgi:signal recognition particle receptor subunit beta